MSTNAEGYEYHKGIGRKAVSFEVVNCKNAAQSIETTWTQKDLQNVKCGVGGIIGFLTNSDTRQESTLTKITNCTSETTNMNAPTNGKCGKLIYNSGKDNKVTIDGTVYTCAATTAYNSVSDFSSTTN